MSTFQKYILLLTFKDLNSTPLSNFKIGLHPQFDINKFNGNILNSHDSSNIATMPLYFELTNNSSLIGVFILNPSSYFVKSTYAYTMKINYDQLSLNMNIYMPPKNNNNLVVCSHDLDPSKTDFQVPGSLNFTVNQDVQISSITTYTIDNNLYNIAQDINNLFIITTTSNLNSVANVYIIPNNNFDGNYILKINTNIADTYNVNVTIKSTKINYLPKSYVILVNCFAENIVSKIEFTDLSNISTDKTNDLPVSIHLKLKDRFGNEINSIPDKSNNYLGIVLTLTIDNQDYPIKYDIQTINIFYNNILKVYSIQDYFTKVGSYQLSVTYNNGQNMLISYKKYPGKVNPNLSSVFLSCNKNLKIGGQIEINLNLFDNTGANLITKSNDLLNSDISNISVNVINMITQESKSIPTKISINGLTFYTKSDAINSVGNYTLSVTSNGLPISCKTLCIVNVDYQTLSFANTVVSVILDKVITLSQNNTISFSNTNNELNIYYDFYDSQGNKLTPIDPTIIKSINTSISDGKNLFISFNQKFSTNSIITASVSTKDIEKYKLAVKGSYNLTLSFKGETLIFPILFLGDGTDSDAGNGDPVLSNTDFSTTTLYNTAGQEGTLTMTLKTSEKLRVNQYFDVSNFQLSFNLLDPTLNYSIKTGPKRGSYIITVKSNISRYDSNGIIMSISFNGNNIPIPINIFNKNSDLSYISLDEKFLNNNNFLNVNASTIDQFPITFKIFDKYNNLYLEIFDKTIWSLERIQRLFNVYHKNGFSTSTLAVTNLVSSSFDLIIKCKFSGVIDISSIYLNSTYSVQVNAGPPYAKNSYAEVNKTSIIAGSLATIKVFPIDLNNNKVNISSLSIDNINNYKVRCCTPTGKIIDLKLLKSTDHYTLNFSTRLIEMGMNTFSVNFYNDPIPMTTSKVYVSIDQIQFNNSKLYYYSNSNLQLITNTQKGFNIDKSSYPTFIFNLTDKFNNTSPTVPDSISISSTLNSNGVILQELCTSLINNVIRLSICNDNQSISNWKYILSKNDYTFYVKKFNSTDSIMEMLSYSINIIGDTFDATASNDPIDLSQTYFSKTLIQATSGQWEQFMIELRTKTRLRKNYWYDNVYSNISVIFSINNNTYYNYKFSNGEKPGQYYLNVLTNKTFSVNDNNQIRISLNNITLNEVYCNYLVFASVPSYGLVYDLNNTKISRQLPDTNADDSSYTFSIKLYDKFNNLAESCLSDMNMIIISPKINYTVYTRINYSQKTFNIQLKPIFAGVYTISSAYFNYNYTFKSYSGAPSSQNSIIIANATAIAGQMQSVYIIPYDKYNNLINPTNLNINKYSLYRKWIENGNYVNYASVPNPTINNYIKSDGTVVSAIQYQVNLTNQNLNVFRGTLETVNEISCQNCFTMVFPNKADFISSLVLVYDFFKGIFEQITDNLVLKNSNSYPIIRVLMRDQYKNMINVIDRNLSYYATISDRKNFVYRLNSSIDPSNSYIEFLKCNDPKINKILYENIVQGYYFLTISNSLNQKITNSIRIIGEGENSDASNDPFSENKTIILDKKLNFQAGGNGNFILEMRTTENTRRNENGFKFNLSISNNDPSFKYEYFSSGMKGRYFFTFNSTIANTYPRKSNVSLKISVTPPNTNDFLLIPIELNIEVSPAIMSYCYIPKSELISSNSTELNKNTSNITLSFTIKGVDKYDNIVVPDLDLIQLYIINPLGYLAKFTQGKDVIKGSSLYEVETSIAGTYKILSNMFNFEGRNYTFKKLPSDISLKNFIIVVKTPTSEAGSNSTLNITARDDYFNVINRIDIWDKFNGYVTTSNNINLNFTKIINSSTNGFSLLISTNLNVSGPNTWNLFYGNINIICSYCITITTPTKEKLSNSLISILNPTTGLYIPITRASNTRSIENPFKTQVKLRDEFSNIINNVQNLKNVTCEIYGNQMTPINLTNSSTNLFSLDFAFSQINEVKFKSLAPGENYIIRFNLTSNDNDTYSISHYLNLTSTKIGKNYGNGLYEVNNTLLSSSNLTLIAGIKSSINITLQTKNGKLYNGDINLDEVKYEVLPKDKNIVVQFIKKPFYPSGVFCVDMISKIIMDSSQLYNMSIRIKNSKSGKYETIPQNIIYSVIPQMPPNSSFTKIVTLPSIIDAGSPLYIQAIFCDLYGNKIKNSTLIDALTLSYNNHTIPNLKKNLINGELYEFSFIPNFPPRNISIDIIYTDNNLGYNINLMPTNAYTYIQSKVNYDNTAVSGKNLLFMKAGENLDLNVYFKDSFNNSINTFENIPITATIKTPNNGKIKNYLDNLNYKFQQVSVSTGIDTYTFYSIIFTPRYQIVGSYSIKVEINIQDKNITIYQGKQLVKPGDIDPSKFKYSLNENGDNFVQNNIPAGSKFNFQVQSFDKFKNLFTNPIPGELKISLKQNKTKVSNDSYLSLMYQGQLGELKGTLQINKSGEYQLDFIYNKKISNGQGALNLNIVPNNCSEIYSQIDLESIDGALPGNPTFATLSCYDEYKNPIITGGEGFTVSTTVSNEKTQTKVKIKTKITDNNNGKYLMQFIPDYAGNYEMKITFNRTGLIYKTIKFIIKSTYCPNERPYTCPNKPKSCVKNKIECIDNNPCKNNNTNPYPCKVNKIDSCVKSRIECDCDRINFTKCSYMKQCVPENRKEELCSFYLKQNCSKINPNYPFLCEDGICRKSKENCPSQRVCPLGNILCPDLTCKPSFEDCNKYTDCKPNQIKCPDLTCVEDQEYCPTTITCGPSQFVCPDGICVDNDTMCLPLQECQDPNPILCPTNSCANEVSNCPKSLTCGTGKSLCPDINCKETCQ